MEQQITWLILTVVLNALVTGVIVSYFNKRLETKFAKRLFEDQVKFQRTHQKRAETLEALYPKFRVFSDQLNKLLENAFIEKNEFVADPEVLDAIRKNFHSSKEYFEDNKIFLDTKEVYDIERIYISFWYIQQIIKFLYLDPYNITDEKASMANAFIKDVPGLNLINPKEPQYVKLALDIFNQTLNLVEQVEKIYRKIH